MFVCSVPSPASCSLLPPQRFSWLVSPGLWLMLPPARVPREYASVCPAQTAAARNATAQEIIVFMNRLLLLGLGGRFVRRRLGRLARGQRFHALGRRCRRRKRHASRRLRLRGSKR